MPHEPEKSIAVRVVVFEVADTRLGIPLEATERVERACEVTPLPGAPEPVIGAVDLQGRLAGVVDLRRRLGLSPRPLQPSDAFVVVYARERLFVLPVDDVEGVVDVPSEMLLPVDAVGEGRAKVRGLVRTREGLLLIDDPDQFLDVNEMRRFADAIDQAAIS